MFASLTKVWYHLGPNPYIKLDIYAHAKFFAQLIWDWCQSHITQSLFPHSKWVILEPIFSFISYSIWASGYTMLFYSRNRTWINERLLETKMRSHFNLGSKSIKISVWIYKKLLWFQQLEVWQIGDDQCNDLYDSMCSFIGRK